MQITKRLREIMLALSATVLLAIPAHAQPAPPTESATPVQIGAARETLHALMFETGLLEQALTEFAQSELPAFRERATDAELRASLSESARAGLDQFVEELPAHIEYELRIGAAELIETTTGPVAPTFSADEWSGIGAFLRDPEGRRLFVKLANGERNSLTEDEIAVARRFYNTDAGRAFAQRGAEMNRILYATMNEALPIIVGRLQLRLMGRFCTALADDCPADIRSLTSGL